jgi:hypothetical protein
MTSEQRLDRLERIAKLFARAGLQTRSEFNKRLEILMDAQMRNEPAIASNQQLFRKLAESQIHTDQRLDALIDIIRRDRNGDSLPNA